MKITSTTVLALVLITASFTGWRLSAEPGAIVVGGEYTLHRGEVLNGDLRSLFAQVAIEDGACLNGRIVSISSTLDLSGAVTGEILGIDSDTSVRGTAQLSQVPRELGVSPYVVLLPRLAGTGVEAGN